jgi:hypothetical protein
MANPVDLNYKGPVSKGGTGYNGMTGAAAQWNEGKGMWVDSAGVEIRDDAITATPVTGGGGGGTPTIQPAAGGGGSAAMNGLASAGGSGGAEALPPMPSMFNIGQPSQANPMLGKGNPAIRNLILAMQRPRNY